MERSCAQQLPVKAEKSLFCHLLRLSGPHMTTIPSTPQNLCERQVVILPRPSNFDPYFPFAFGPHFLPVSGPVRLISGQAFVPDNLLISVVISSPSPFASEAEGLVYFLMVHGQGYTPEWKFILLPLNISDPINTRLR